MTGNYFWSEVTSIYQTQSANYGKNRYAFHLLQGTSVQLSVLTQDLRTGK